MTGRPVRRAYREGRRHRVLATGERPAYIRGPLAPAELPFPSTLPRWRSISVVPTTRAWSDGPSLVASVSPREPAPLRKGPLYEAEDPEGRRVVLLILPPRVRGRSRRARGPSGSAAKIRHPNVAAVHALGEPGGRLHLRRPRRAGRGAPVESPEREIGPADRGSPRAHTPGRLGPGGRAPGRIRPRKRVPEYDRGDPSTVRQITGQARRLQSGHRPATRQPGSIPGAPPTPARSVSRGACRTCGTTSSALGPCFTTSSAAARRHRVVSAMCPGSPAPSSRRRSHDCRPHAFRGCRSFGRRWRPWPRRP